VARPLEVKGPNTAEEVESAYKVATDKYDRERLLAIHMALEGELSLSEIAKALMRGVRSIKRWLKAFRKGGIDSLLERQHHDKPARLSDEMKKELKEGLKSGRWANAAEILSWLEEEHQVKMTESGIRYWLKRLRASFKVPATSHVDKNPEEAEKFKKDFDQQLTKLTAPEGKKIYIWVMDEHRYGLNSLTRKVWTLIGERPVVPYQKKRKWGDLYGAMEVGTGRAELLYTSGVSLEWTYIFLEQLAATDPEGIHVVIGDRATWHPLPDDPLLPKGISILPLPAYSPELNPAEGLWKPVKNAVANAAYRTMKQVESVITEAMRPFLNSAKRVCRLLGAHWTTRAIANFLGQPCGAITNSV
jgi:transposase